MNNHLYLLLILLFACNITIGATIINGTVTDAQTNEGIPYATFSVTSTSDSIAFLKRFASNDQGKFSEEIPNAGNYILTITSIGYENYTKEFTIKVGQKNYSFGKINMKESSDSLTEVVVVAQKPLVKVDTDRLTYDIEGDPDSKTNTTLEMLRKVPLITVDGDDNIQLKGSSNFKIYMNGKPSNIIAKNPSDALKSIPASTIKEVEVITEPGAKYDAEGIGGIINIVTISTLAGYTGSVRVGVNTFGSPNAGFYIASKMGKFGLTANLNYSGNRSPRFSNENSREQFANIQNKYIRQYSSGNGNSNYGYGSIEANYDIDSLNLISLSFSGNLGGGKNISNGQTVMENSERDTTTLFNMNTDASNFWSGMNVSLNYQHMFMKPNKLLTFSFQGDFTPNEQNNTTSYEGIKNYQSYEQRSRSKANGSEYTFQADYTEPFDSNRHTMEVGIKYILRNNISHNYYYNLDTLTNEWITQPKLFNQDLNQLQHIVSAYGSYSFRYKMFHLRAGLRLEYSEQHIESDTSFNARYFNVVPSILLGYKIGMSSNFSLSYTQRLQRPGIWYLNPYYDNTDPLNVVQGNPDLKPTMSHSLSFSYGFFNPKFNFNTSANFSYTDNGINSITTQLNDSVLYTSYYNVAKRLSGGLSLYMNWTILPIWQFYMNGGVNYNYMETSNQSLSSQGFNFSLFAGTNFTLPWKL